MKSIATYQRVSREEQSRDTDAYIRQGWQLDQTAANFSDRTRLSFADIQSGRKDNRPDMLKLIAAIESGSIDTLIVTRIDRIGRDLEANARLQKQLERKHVRVFEILLGRFLEWTNPHDWSYFCKAGLEGEQESRMLSARIKQTFEWHRSQGKMGGGRVGFPYRRSKEGFIEPDSAMWDKAVECIRIVAQHGTGMKALAHIRELGLNRTRTWLFDWVRSPLLRGHTPQWTRKEGGGKHHPHLVSTVRDTHKSLFLDPRLKGLQKQLDRIIEDSSRLKGAVRSRPVYPLSGLIYCARCGKSCHIKTISNAKYPDKRYTYVFCSDRDSRGIGCGGAYGMFKGHKKSINSVYSDVDTAVMMELTKRAVDLVDLAIADRPSEKQEDVAIIELKSQIQRLKDLNDPDLESAIAKKTTQLNTLLIADPDDKISEQVRLEFIELFSTIDVFVTMNNVDKRTLYRDWVSKILVDKTDVKVSLII